MYRGSLYALWVEGLACVGERRGSLGNDLLSLTTVYEFPPHPNQLISHAVPHRSSFFKFDVDTLFGVLFTMGSGGIGLQHTHTHTRAFSLCVFLLPGRCHRNHSRSLPRLLGGSRPALPPAHAALVRRLLQGCRPGAVKVGVLDVLARVACFACILLATVTLT